MILVIFPPNVGPLLVYFEGRRGKEPQPVPDQVWWLEPIAQGVVKAMVEGVVPGAGIQKDLEGMLP